MKRLKAKEIIGVWVLPKILWDEWIYVDGKKFYPSKFIVDSIDHTTLLDTSDTVVGLGKIEYINDDNEKHYEIAKFEFVWDHDLKQWLLKEWKVIEKYVI